MDWLSILLSVVGGGGVFTVLADILYFRPKLKELRAGASKAETEAQEAKVNYLVERINSIEKLYKEQGVTLDNLRRRSLMTDEKLSEKNKVIANLQSENRSMVEKVQKLENEIEAYKQINKSLNDKVDLMERELSEYRSRLQ